MENKNEFLIPLTGKEHLRPQREIQLAAIHAYVAMLRLMNYSENTIRTYQNWFLYFLKNFPGELEIF